MVKNLIGSLEILMLRNLDTSKFPCSKNPHFSKLDESKIFEQGSVNNPKSQYNFVYKFSNKLHRKTVLDQFVSITQRPFSFHQIVQDSSNLQQLPVLQRNPRKLAINCCLIGTVTRSLVQFDAGRNSTRQKLGQARVHVRRAEARANFAS